MLATIYLLSACWSEAELPLPETRLPESIDARMVRYDNLRGYLMRHEHPKTAHIWQVEQLNAPIKKCAHTRMPASSMVLLVTDKNLQNAEHYIKKITNFEPQKQHFTCPRIQP